MTAPPLLLLHGFLHSSFTWRFNIEPLARDFRVIAPCLMGLGYSEKSRGDYSLAGMTAFVRALMETLEMGPAHVVGNSLGGMIALDLASSHPHVVSTLVLVDPVGPRFQLPFWVRTMLSPSLSWPWNRLLFNHRLIHWILQQRVYRAIQVDRTLKEGFMAPLMLKGTRPAALEIIRRLPEGVRRVIPTLGSLDHETLMVWGRQDGLVPVKAGHVLNKLLPRSSLVVFERSGHCPHEEEPERFNRLVREFLLSV